MKGTQDSFSQPLVDGSLALPVAGYCMQSLHLRKMGRLVGKVTDSGGGFLDKP